MAIARKPGKPAKSAIIDATAETVSVAAETVADAVEPALPTLQETFDATLGKAEEMQEQIRRTAEQGVEQTKRVYERLKTMAEEATSTVETSLSTVSRGVSEINLKALELVKANSDAQYAFVRALLSTRSLSEAITLQSEHARTQFETLNAQAKELAALIQQVSAESVEPIKASFTRSLQSAS
jgi:phasin